MCLNSAAMFGARRQEQCGCACSGVAAKDPDLKGVLRGFRGAAGLSMQWLLFGTSGHIKRPQPGGPLAHFTKCTGQLSFQMKCLANMWHAAHHMMVGNTVHDCTYKCVPADWIHWLVVYGLPCAFVFCGGAACAASLLPHQLCVLIARSALQTLLALAVVCK